MRRYVMANKNRLKNKLAIAIIFFTFIGLIFLGIKLSGMFLFLSFHENPLNANFWTIFDALGSLETQRQKLKIIGSLFLGMFLMLAIPFGMLMAYRKYSQNIYGDARFATKEDIDAEGLNAKGGVILGRFEDEFVKLGGYEFVLLAAPTRTGKGVGFVIPNLLTFPDSAVVLDIKGENYNLTSAFRAKHLQNDVFYFNPFSENTHRWNPLSYVSTDPRFRVNDLTALAAIIYPTVERDPFWSDSARNLFIGLSLLVLETPKLPQTFGEVLRQGSGKGRATEEYISSVIEARKNTDTPLSSRCVDALNRFLNNSENTLKSILASFIAPLSIFDNPVIDKATSANDFDLREIRKRKMTIYLHVPAGEVMQASFILNLFFSQLITENVKELPEENPDLKYQCLMMLDEFTAIGKVAIIAKGVGYMAGYNMRLALIIQSNSQLESTYGKEDSHSIIENMGAVIYYTPTQNQEAEEYSKMIGYRTVTNTSIQHANVGALNAGKYSKSETESVVSRALMLPQELLALDKEKELIRRSGMPIVLADKIRYFKDSFFMSRFTAIPMRQINVGGESRNVPIPLTLPTQNWRIYHTTTSLSDYYVIGDLSDLNKRTETADVSLLLDIINEPDSENTGNDSETMRETACEDLAAKKVAEWAELFAQAGTTDKDVL